MTWHYTKRYLLEQLLKRIKPDLQQHELDDLIDEIRNILGLGKG